MGTMAISSRQVLPKVTHAGAWLSSMVVECINAGDLRQPLVLLRLSSPFLPPPTDSADLMSDSMQSTNPRKRQRLEEYVGSDVPTSEVSPMSSVQLPRLTPLVQSVDTADGQHNAAATGLKSQPVNGLPAAMRVILALQRAKRHLRAIGVCPTKHAAQTKMMLENGPRPDDTNKHHQVIFSGDSEALGKKAGTEEQKAKAAQDRHNKVRPANLSEKLSFSLLSDRCALSGTLRDAEGCRGCKFEELCVWPHGRALQPPR